MPEPPLAAGSGLDLSLSYNSQSVDAFTQSTNNQSGLVGLGWNLHPGYIERKFRSCAEDAGDGSPKEHADQELWGDLCWESPDENDGEGDTDDYTTSELYLSLNGKSTRIVKDRVSGEWRTEQDFGWRLELVSGGAHKEYWRIWTRDGTRYRFGYTDGSNWHVPVIGDDPGEPSYDEYPTARKHSWRWNLDEVRDRDENVTDLVWQEETNHYQRLRNGNIARYDRGGWLDRIEYGSNLQVAGSIPTGKVEFRVRDRCVEGTVRDDPVANPYPVDICPAVNASNASSYPDVPVDLKCGSGSCSQFSPTFWSTKRLDRITTFRWRADVADWRNIYQLQLQFKTYNPPGLTGEVLWLNRIFPVGLIGSDANKVRLPGVDFNPEYLSGRVDHDEAGQGVSEMILPRVYRFYNGYGGRTDVTYGHVAPCPTGGSAESNDEYWDWYNPKEDEWDLNTDECAPVWYKPEHAPAGWGQFHKYLALKVVQRDRVGGSPNMVTEYEYRGDAAWALGYGFIDADGESESWNEWRGYPTVRVHTGSGTNPDKYSMTETTFFRGLYFDYFSDWETFKHVEVTNYDGGSYDDLPGKAGRPLQTRHYQMTSYAPDPADREFTEVSSSRFAYAWINTGDGPERRNPRMAPLTYQRDRVKLDDGSWRERMRPRRAEFNSYGLPTKIVDSGEIGAADNTCTTITYATRDQDTNYLVDFPETTETWNKNTCGEGEVIAKTVNLYDGRGSGDIGSQLPYDGDLTEQRVYTSTSDYVATQATYDTYGRQTSTTDELGETTTIDYTPAVNWPLDGVTTTNPAGHTVTTQVSEEHGQILRVVDADGKQTDINYDRLGRPVEVFLPGEPESAGIPSLTFDYTYTFDGTAGLPSAATRVGTHTLASKANGGEYLSEYAFDDGFGRLRETQTASPAGGRVVTATGYDPRGETVNVSAPFHSSGNPGDGLVDAAFGALPSWTHTNLDTLGRPTAEIAMTGGSELWRTSTEYHGDHKMITPPDGAPPVTVFHDVRDNTVLRQEHLPGGGTVDTSYEWDLENQLTGVADDAGNTWTYTYDLAGRKLSADDPDSGLTSHTYDAAGQIISTTDARGQTITTDYDQLGRPTDRWDGDSGTGTKLAEWVYDTLQAGQPTSSTRWHQGQAYTNAVDGYTDRYQPTGRTVSIPSTEGALAGTYQFGYSYTDVGWAETVTLPAAGGMPAETLTTSYTPLGQPDRLTSDLDGGTTYVHATSYDKTGDMVQQLLGDSGAQVARDLAWDEATNRLTGTTTTAGVDTATPNLVQDDTYTYDPAGNVTAITDEVTGQAQCFVYDQLRRLTEAWTTASATCSDAPSEAAVDGPDPYWHSWSFDTIGNRLTHAKHPTAAGGDQETTTYTYPTGGGPQPHTLTERQVTDPGGTVVDSYNYDSVGNTINRPGETGQQTLTWDPEGNLATVTDGTEVTDYIYDMSGNRLITHKPDGTATLYLPEGMEIHTDGGGVQTCTRYYGGIAVRTSDDGLSWQAADHHGTATHVIAADTLTVVTRRSDPYGNPRGPVVGGTWPDDKGFLGAPVDPATGLTHLGAREYDPTTGRFISVDPVMDLTDPQQMHGYTYSNNNPTTYSDPTGLKLCKDTGCEVTVAAPEATTGGSSSSGGGGNGGVTEKEYDNSSKPEIHKVIESTEYYTITEDNRGVLYVNGYRVPEGGPTSQQLVDELAHYCSIGPAYHCDNMTCLPGDTVCWEQVGYFIAQNIRSALWGKYSAEFDDGLYGTWSEELAIAGAIYGWGPGGSARMAGGRGSRICVNSFISGTQVLMADGTTKPIEEIELGEMVLATDPETGVTEPQPVTDTITGTGQKALVQITVDAGGWTSVGDSVIAESQLWMATITATANHPFWVEDSGTWTDAGDLRSGSQLGSDSSVATVVAYTGTVTVYNLTIANIHTYHVIAGSAPVLVHNCDGLTAHARARLAQKGVSKEEASKVLQRTPFSYWHDGQWKSGYYDPKSKLFIAKTIGCGSRGVTVIMRQA